MPWPIVWMSGAAGMVSPVVGPDSATDVGDESVCIVRLAAGTSHKVQPGKMFPWELLIENRSGPTSSDSPISDVLQQAAEMFATPAPISEADLALIRRIEELHLDYPFLGRRHHEHAVFPYLLRRLTINLRN